jgi:hypothetical protein
MQPTLFPSNILPRTIFMRNCSHSVQLPRQFCKIGSRECKEETGTGQQYRPSAEQAREYKEDSRTGQKYRPFLEQDKEYREASRTGQEYRPGAEQAMKCKEASWTGQE